jgi:hypothetical protein
VLTRETNQGDRLTVVIYLGSDGTVVVPRRDRAAVSDAAARLMFSTEDSAYALDPRPIVVETQDEFDHITFPRPGAVILRHSR